jgi:hypothetical protein
MPGNIISEMVIALGLDKKKLDQGLLQAQAQIQGFSRGIASFIAPLAGALSFGALFGNWASEADRLGKFAGMIGESITTVDAWGQAVKMAGGSAEGFQGSLQSLNTDLAMIAKTGTGRAKAALDALGVSATDAQGKTKKASDVLLELAAKAGSMDKSGFAGLARTAGLDSGTIMLLQSGKKATLELVEAQKALAYTPEDAANAARFNDSIALLKKSLMSAVSVLFNAIAPAVTFIADKLGKFFAFLARHKTFVLAFLGAIATAIAIGLVPALYALSAAWMTAMAPMLAVGAGLALIAAIFDDIYTWMEGGESLVGDFFGPFETAVESLKNKFSEADKFIRSIFADIGDFFSNLFSGLFDGLTNALKDLIRTLPGFLVPGEILEWANESGPKAVETQNVAPLKERDSVDAAYADFYGPQVTDSKRGGAVETQNIAPPDFSDMLSGFGEYLNLLVSPMPPLAAMAGANNSNITNDTQINQITINTPATDARGIADEIPGALHGAFERNAAVNAGTATKG